MGRKAGDKSDLAAFVLKLKKDSVEEKWLENQDNKTLSLKILIKKALYQYGNVDVKQIAIDNFVKNPETNFGMSSKSKEINDNQKNFENTNDKKLVTSKATEEVFENKSNANKSSSADNKKVKKKIITKSQNKSENYSDAVRNLLPPEFRGIE